MVSIHAPAGGATITSGGNCKDQYVFQSTHPQGVRREEKPLLTYTINVSIHAPAGGATHKVKGKRNNRKVSIHAPAGGATGSHEAD